MTTLLDQSCAVDYGIKSACCLSDVYIDVLCRLRIKRRMYEQNTGILHTLYSIRPIDISQIQKRYKSNFNVRPRANFRSCIKKLDLYLFFYIYEILICIDLFWLS